MSRIVYEYRPKGAESVRRSVSVDDEAESSDYDVWSHDSRVTEGQHVPVWIAVCGFHWADVKAQVSSKAHRKG
jgi:hypothetical protein